jgi:hypothetical protein
MLRKRNGGTGWVENNPPQNFKIKKQVSFLGPEDFSNTFSMAKKNITNF